MAQPVPWPPHPDDIISIDYSGQITTTPVALYTVPSNRDLVICHIQATLVTHVEDNWQLYYDTVPATVQHNIIPERATKWALNEPLYFDAQPVGIPVPPDAIIYVKTLESRPNDLQLLILGYQVGQGN